MHHDLPLNSGISRIIRAQHVFPVGCERHVAVGPAQVWLRYPVHGCPRGNVVEFHDDSIAGHSVPKRQYPSIWAKFQSFPTE